MAFPFAESETRGLVSIVIPTYRGDRFIGDALSSVGDQTYPHWEVFIVEDTSQGDTQGIVEQFARRHPARRVEYSCNDRNSGPSYSRNVAFAKSRGEFIAPLDCDDRWQPSYLASYVECLQASGKDLAYSSVVMIEDHTDLLLGVLGPTAQELANFPLCLFHRNFIITSATMFRRQVLADVGPWDEDLRWAEDLAYWLRCVAAGKQFHHVGGCHCLYRKNAADAATQRVAASLEAVAKVTERHMLGGIHENACRRYVSRAYRRAARRHVQAHPLRDPSADPSRAAQLWLHAWRAKPMRFDCMIRAVLRRMIDAVRPTSQPPSLRSESPAPRAAA